MALSFVVVYEHGGALVPEQQDTEPVQLQFDHVPPSTPR